MNVEQVVSNDGEYYYKNGQRYDRVTKVIGATVGRFEIEQWRKRVGADKASMISEEASEWGNQVHLITAISDKKFKGSLMNRLAREEHLDSLLKTNPNLLPSLLAWNDWVKEVVTKWIMVEQVVYSDRLMIAGTIDRVGYIKGDIHPSIIDIKTGGFWESAGIQVWGAYRELYNENRGRKKEVRRGLVVQLPKDEPGVLRVKEVTKDKYIEGWENAKKDYWNVMGR